MKFIANTSDLSKYLKVPISKNKIITNISIDTRTIQKDSLFIAIQGKNFDGNDFVNDAIAKGAVIVIADNKRYKNNQNKKIIYVRNSILALKKITQNILKSYDGRVIAITGSNGKTTTTNIISKTLGNSSSTLKNFNNEIGMPLSVMNASPKSKYLVLEIGASKFKDIDYLSKILKPSIGVITNIGHSHLEKLRNINGVFKVKSEIIKNIQKGGILIVPSDNKDHLDKWKKMRSDLKVYSFGISKDSDFYATDIKTKTNGLTFTICSEKINKPVQINSFLEGQHNINNILAGFAVYYCYKFNLADDRYLNPKGWGEMDYSAVPLTYVTTSEPKRFCATLTNAKHFKNVRQIKSKWINGSILINDTYNANPDSAKKSIDLLSNYKKNTVLVLGDMLELGRYKKKLHKEIGKYAKAKGINKLLGYGDLTKQTTDIFGKNGIFFKKEDDLKAYLKKNITSKDVILIKGSRGMKMERFIDV